MKRYRIEVAPKARRQFLTVLEWWIENRPDTPDLFLREFENVTSLLAESPSVGAIYRRGEGTIVRRILLPQTRYHLYYEFMESRDLVQILAVWHTSRAKGPPV